MKGPPSVVRYVFTHAVPIMKAHPPHRWWHACQEIKDEEVRQEVTAWLRREKHKMDCWARHPQSIQETKKPRR